MVSRIVLVLFLIVTPVIKLHHDRNNERFSNMVQRIVQLASIVVAVTKMVFAPGSEAFSSGRSSTLYSDEIMDCINRSSK